MICVESAKQDRGKGKIASYCLSLGTARHRRAYLDVDCVECCLETTLVLPGNYTSVVSGQHFDRLWRQKCCLETTLV